MSALGSSFLPSVTHQFYLSHTSKILMQQILVGKYESTQHNTHKELYMFLLSSPMVVTHISLWLENLQKQHIHESSNCKEHQVCCPKYKQQTPVPMEFDGAHQRKANRLTRNQSHGLLLKRVGLSRTNRNDPLVLQEA